MNKKTIFFIIIALLISATVFLVGYNEVKSPQTVYKVYLDGQAIGLIESKEALEAYINQEQNEIKDKYGVDKVYLPNNLDIEKETTYSNNISSIEEIYDKIKDIAPFTISGYEIKIKGVEISTDEHIETTKTVNVYVLNRDIFVDAVENTILTFVDEDHYEKFKHNTQEEIKDVGSIIENVYIENDITIKQTNISVEENIYTDKDQLSKYLLFGDADEQEYEVKKGDTVEDIAFNNKMSVNEFLVANPDITSADNLLYTGQKVKVGLIDTAFRVIEEEYIVEYQTVEYETVYEYDSSLPMGKETVKQKGSNGTAKVAYTVERANGESVSIDTKNTETIVPAQDRIVVKGTKVLSGVGVGTKQKWYWPTEKKYRNNITSPYGYRWGGQFHAGVDIAGGRGSKIYAANNGVVVESTFDQFYQNGRKRGNGHYIIIDHNNGWYTAYAHMSSRTVKIGDKVEMGQVIGYMGDTGFATGVHLHFGLWRGYPFRNGCQTLNCTANPLRAVSYK